MHLLQQLVQIPSVNPDNAAPDQAGVTHEQAMADFLANWLEDIGAQVTLEEIHPRRPNLIARFAPLDGRPRILLGPHLDTVGVENMTIEPFSGKLEDGKIWGRGSSDTKGPMAAMLAGLKANKDILKGLPVAVDFVGFMGEEASQHGSKNFAQRHAKNYKFAIAGEPTSMQVVYTTKGSLWATLEASGISAHASQPHLGENAILKLSQALIALQKELAMRLKSFTHDVLGFSTMNIGTISGGSAPNIVPNRATAQIDIRQTPSLAAAGGALQLLRETIHHLQLPITVQDTAENPPMDTNPENHYIQLLQKTDNRVGLCGAPWFSDAAHLAAVGLPSICLGPGSIDQAHTKDEFIEVARLEEGEQIFSSFIRSLK